LARVNIGLGGSPQPPTKKFFEFRQEDWPIRLSPWTAL